MSQEKPDPTYPEENSSDSKRIGNDPFAFLRAKLMGEEARAKLMGEEAKDPDTEHNDLMLQSIVVHSEEDLEEYGQTYDRAMAASEPPQQPRNNMFDLARASSVDGFLARSNAASKFLHAPEAIPEDETDDPEWGTDSMIVRKLKRAEEAAEIEPLEDEDNNLPPAVIADPAPPQLDMKQRQNSLSALLSNRQKPEQKIQPPLVPFFPPLPSNIPPDAQTTSSAPTAPPPAPAYDPTRATPAFKQIPAKTGVSATQPAPSSVAPAKPDLMSELQSKLKLNSVKQPIVQQNPASTAPATATFPTLRKTPGPTQPTQASTSAPPTWPPLRPTVSPRTSQTLPAEELKPPVVASNAAVKIDFVAPEPPLKKNSQPKAPQTKNPTAPGNDLRKSAGQIKGAPPKVAPSNTTRPLPPLQTPLSQSETAVKSTSSLMDEPTSPKPPQSLEKQYRDLQARYNGRDQEFRQIIVRQSAIHSRLAEENARLQEALARAQSRYDSKSETERAIRGVNATLALENDRLLNLVRGQSVTQASRARSSSNAAHAPSNAFFPAAPERPSGTSLPQHSPAPRWSDVRLIPNWKTEYESQLAVINLYKADSQTLKQCIISTLRTCPDASDYPNKHAISLTSQLMKLTQQPILAFYQMLTSYRDGEGDKTFENLRQACIHFLVNIEQQKEIATAHQVGASVLK